MTYTLFNPDTYDVLYSQEFDTAPANSTTSIMTESFVKPKYNPITDTFYEGATPQEVYEADPRTWPDYYLTREVVGKELVNEVSNVLLQKYKQGQLTLSEIMAIEESLKEVIYSLRGGQFITAKYKLSIAVDVPQTMKDDLEISINQLIIKHYVN